MYKYRKRSPIGGLAADLTARLDDAAGGELVGVTRIYRQINLAQPREGLYWKDLSWMAFALSLHGPALMSRFPQGAVFRVIDFTFPLADYRPEVAALAVDGWLSQELGFPGAGLSVRFDPDRSEYCFDFADARPFSGD